MQKVATIIAMLECAQKHIWYMCILNKNKNYIKIPKIFYAPWLRMGKKCN